MVTEEFVSNKIGYNNSLSRECKSDALSIAEAKRKAILEKRVRRLSDQVKHFLIAYILLLLKRFNKQIKRIHKN